MKENSGLISVDFDLSDVLRPSKTAQFSIKSDSDGRFLIKNAWRCWQNAILPSHDKNVPKWVVNKTKKRIKIIVRSIS